ncbi:MAG: hypothetical protein H6Q32_1407 [Bacteroidetes bacterium]|nr:hypothetical protein [Bacteroidota bacterium]
MSPTMVALQRDEIAGSIGRTSIPMIRASCVSDRRSMSPCPISPLAPVTRIAGLRIWSVIGLFDKEWNGMKDG